MRGRLLFVIGMGLFGLSFFCIRGAFAVWPAWLDLPIGFLAALGGLLIWILGNQVGKAPGEPMGRRKRSVATWLLWTSVLGCLAGLFLGPLPWVAKKWAPPQAVSRPAGDSANPFTPQTNQPSPEPQKPVAAPSAESEKGTSNDSKASETAQNDQPPKGEGSSPEGQQQPEQAPLAQRWQDWLRSHRWWVVALWIASAALLVWLVRRFIKKNRPVPIANEGPATAEAAWPDYIKDLRRLSADWGLPPAPGHTLQEIEQSWESSGRPAEALEPLKAYHYKVTYEVAPQEPMQEKGFRRLIRLLSNRGRKP